MAIKGSLNEASLPDIIQLLSVGQKTGVLSITNRQNFGNIYLKDGNVIFANIVNREDRIGDILVRRGRITKPDLEKAIKIQQEDASHRLFGTILVEMGLISHDELINHLQIQIEEAIYTLLTWRDGFFVFEPNRLPDDNVPTVQIRTNSLVMEAARRIDEWEVMSKKIPSVHLPIQPMFDKSAPDSPLHRKGENYSEAEITVLSLVNGKRTIQDIADLTSINEFDVAKMIYGFLTANMVSLIKQAAPQRTVSQQTEFRRNEASNLGFAFLKAELYEEARKEYEKITQIDPDDENANFYLGVIAFEQRKFDVAVEYFQSILAINDGHSSVYNNLAMAYEAQNDLKNAIRTYEKGLEKNPHHLKMQIGLGRLMIRTGDLERAKKILENSRDRDPEYPMTFFYLSLLYIKEKRYEDALQLLQSLDDEFKEAAIFNNEAVLYEIIGESKKAIDIYKSALKNTPNLLNSRLGLADIYYRNGWHQDAMTEYQKVVELNPLSSDAYFKMGNIHMKYHEKNKAIECWEKSLAIDPNNELLRRNIETVKKLKLT